MMMMMMMMMIMLPSFLPDDDDDDDDDELYSKTIVGMQIFDIPNDCSATWLLLFLAWGGVRAMTMKLQVSISKDTLHSGASVKLFREWHMESGHTWTTERMEL